MFDYFRNCSSNANLSNISDYIVYMAFKRGMTVDFYGGNIYTHAHSDDVDLDFENVCKARPFCFALQLKPTY